MARRFFVAAASVAALLASAVAAEAGTLLIAADDGNWTAQTSSGAKQFTKQGAASVRRGNSGGTGDWEYAVVDANDAPIGTPGQLAWGSGSNFGLAPHQPFLTYTAAGQLSLAFSRAEQPYAASANVGAGVNTLWIRARTGSGPSGSVASLSGLTLIFADNTSVALGDLFGDTNANYLGYADARLAQGFRLGFDTGAFGIGSVNSGSGVMLQVKVGQSPMGAVPEPSTWALMIGGFGLVGAGLRRRAVAVATA